MKHQRHPVSIDISTVSIEIPQLGVIDFPLDRLSAQCLLNGIDSLDYLLAKMDEIKRFEADKTT